MAESKKEMDLNNEEVRDVTAATVNMLRSNARNVHAQSVSLNQGLTHAIEADTVGVDCGLAGITRSRSVHIEKGGVGVVNAGSVTLKDGFAGVIRASKVTTDHVNSVFLVSDNVKGDVSTVFDKKSTIILGSIVGAVIFIVGILHAILKRK